MRHAITGTQIRNEASLVESILSRPLVEGMSIDAIERKKQWAILLRPTGATTWGWTRLNPSGGSEGSSAKNKRHALSMALRVKDSVKDEIRQSQGGRIPVYVGTMDGDDYVYQEADSVMVEAKERDIPIYGYYVNNDERGDFYADVRDEDGNTVYDVRSDEETGEVAEVEDGYMRNNEDVAGLESYLKKQGIIPKVAELLPSRRFETRLKSESLGEAAERFTDSDLQNMDRYELLKLIRAKKVEYKVVDAALEKVKKYSVLDWLGDQLAKDDVKESMDLEDDPALQEARRALGESPADPKSFSGALAQDIRKAMSGSRGMQFKGIKFIPKNKEVFVLVDIDRQFRHPDEYGMSDEDPKMTAFRAAESKISDIISKYQKANPGFKISRAGDVSGADIIRLESAQ